MAPILDQHNVRVGIGAGAILMLTMLFGGYNKIRWTLAGPVEGRGIPWHPLTSYATYRIPRVVSPGVAPGRVMSPDRVMTIGTDGGSAVIQDLLVVNDMLVVAYRGGDRLRVANRQTGAVIASGFPSRGATSRGPAGREFSALTRDPHHRDRVWVHETAARAFMNIDLSRAANRTLDATTVRDRVTLGGVGIIRDPVVTLSGLVGSAFVDRGLLERFDLRGRAVDLIGTAPPGTDTLPEDVRHHLTFGSLAPEPGGARLVLAYQAQPRIDLLSPGGAQIASLVWDDGLPGKSYLIRKDANGVDRFGIRRGFRNGFLDVCTTKRHIYALYGGGAVDSDLTKFSLGSVILVLDWDGGVRQVLTLSSPITRLTASPDDEMLYGVANHGSVILTYRLPQLAKYL